jgi:hypothetical protein
MADLSLEKFQKLQEYIGLILRDNGKIGIPSLEWHDAPDEKVRQFVADWDKLANLVNPAVDAFTAKYPEVFPPGS